MNYLLELRSEEPCDIFLVGNDKGVYALVIESQTAYSSKLADECSTPFTLLCGKHKFAHQKLEVTIVDDFALVDGSACYTVLEMSAAAKEVYNREISGS